MAGGGEGSGSGSGGCEVPPGQPGLVWEGESEEGVELGLEGGGGAHQGRGQGPGADTAMVTTNSNMYTGACTAVHCTYVHSSLYSCTLYMCTQADEVSGDEGDEGYSRNSDESALVRSHDVMRGVVTSLGVS